MPEPDPSIDALRPVSGDALLQRAHAVLREAFALPFPGAGATLALARLDADVTEPAAPVLAVAS